MFGLESLLRCLDDGDNLDIGYHRVFGGQILAQMIAAAAKASPEKSVKSINVLFPREGDTGMRIDYRVDKYQDGRTFGTTGVVATQGAPDSSPEQHPEKHKVISVATVSMHVDEASSLHRSDPLPAVAAPDDCPRRPLDMVPWEVRVVDGVDLADRAAAPPDFAMWMKTPDLPDDRHVHQALLAHATDLTVIGTALRPFDGVSQADSTVTLHTAVTSHSLWFHQPFRLDQWLLVAQHSPVVAGGRAFGRGDVFTEAGEVVASFAQESMVRQI